MADNSKTGNERSGNAACMTMVSGVLDDYTEKLITMVSNSAAGITTADIRNFLIVYKEGQLKGGTPVYAEQYQKCQTLQEQEMFDGSRTEPFRKIIVMRLGKLFPPEGKLTDDGKYLSRRLLQGLFSTLEKMTGAEGGEAGTQICFDEIAKLKKSGGGKFLWEDLYKNLAVASAVDDLIMAMIPHMANIHKRAVWMRTMINNDLGSTIEYEFEGPAVDGWELDERGTFMLMRELVANFRPKLKDKATAATLIQKYGKEQVQALLGVIKSLDAAEV
ncbi:MAG: hypothetical protein KAI27_02505 [Rhodospirillaceae bacterium]|nr:hypothetical protein [Rhodospirillaceae bacterium]